jgi:hypothetical protein
VTEKDQQLLWLGEVYPDLERIAQAIIVDSKTAAEDVTSNAVSKVMDQIEKGKKFETKGNFFAYVRLAVRRCASEYFTKYNGDVVKDVAKSNLIKTLHPDSRRTPVYNVDIDSEDFNPYERYEDADAAEPENKYA